MNKYTISYIAMPTPAGNALKKYVATVEADYFVIRDGVCFFYKKVDTTYGADKFLFAWSTNNIVIEPVDG